MSQNPTLKPCPFCGETRIFLNPSSPTYPRGSINCPACLVCLPCEVNESELIECWNRRALREAPVPSEEPVAKAFERFPRAEDAIKVLRAPDPSMALVPDAIRRSLAELIEQLCAALVKKAEPTLASPAVAPVASVKPLTWKFFDVKHDHGQGVWDANHIYGTFSILDCAFERFGEMNRFYVPHLSKQFVTLEAAQTAVFEQHSQRILSSIIPATKGGEDDLVATLKDFARSAKMEDRVNEASVLLRAADALAALAQDTDGEAKP